MLQQLHERYKEKGVVVLGFPSNDFGGQEPGDNAAIKAFASKEYGVTFPLFDKVHATGAEIAPLYKFLTEKVDEKLRGPVKWNFTKFVVDKTGKVTARFDSKVTPLDAELTSAIEKTL
jgi:glutathione peroxidase